MKGLFIGLISQLFLTFAYAGVTVIPAPPAVNAGAYMLQDFASGRILVSHNSEQKMSPASLTKMMTVYAAAKELALGNTTLETPVLISEKAWKMGGSRMFIEVGKQVSVNDLLYGVIVQSGNDASVALAEHISGSEENFAELMNHYADRLGMYNSHFVNATGWPHEQHYTSAKDMAILAQALIRDTPEIYRLHSVKEFTFNNITQKNRNKLLWRDANVDGIKTGHTEDAGFCLVASAEKQGMRLISVIMGAQSDNGRIKASQALFSYGFRFYETSKMYDAGEAITSVKVWKGQQDNMSLGATADLYITFPRGKKEQLKMEFDLADRYIAPINQGTVQGNLRIALADDEITQVELIALQAIKKGGLMVRLKDNFKLFFK